MKDVIAALGPVTAVIGAQWGDEGKGKIIDLLAEHYDIAARACGGANAGHTIVFGGQKRVFHLLPSGALHPEVTIVLGGGMVLHLPTLLEEIAHLETAGIPVRKRLRISTDAHIVFEYHKAVDGALEDRRSGSAKGSVGTTRRGIGPAYADKAYRTGIRMGDIIAEGGARMRESLERNALIVKEAFGITVDLADELQHVEVAKDIIGSCITDTVGLLHESLLERKRLLIEGAQATLLDIDHGTYPYVTSSATTSAGALQGLGLPPQALTSCIGVLKAYCTRVGGGPFPAEAEEARATRLRERGHEYGATTGRPRRCGWLSIPDIRFASRISGFTGLNVTKLDVLDEEKTIPVLTDEGFIELPGWQQSTEGITDFDDLPKPAQEYITFIEERLRTPVTFIGTGPDREQMIFRS